MDGQVQCQRTNLNFRKRKSKLFLFYILYILHIFLNNYLRPKESKKTSTALIPIFHNFDPLAFLKFPKTSNPSLSSNYFRPRQTSQETEFEIEEISDHLTTILLKDEQNLLNKTGRIQNQKPRWPITTTRDQHGDNDVFLARANNPFGHSTKWKYK